MEKIARPFRVCLTGAESTGKSELAKELAAHFHAPWVPEYAREYAERVARELSYMDVYPIARGQMELEKSVTEGANDLVVLDTDLLSTVIYSRHHFGACPIVVESLARTRLADLYLLLDIDVPWVADPVRDTGATRDLLHELFCDVLEEFRANVRTISGTWDERLRRAIEITTKGTKGAKDTTLQA
jgi:HTH-type transcriptional regulator, transcriptional repressor of NAD biosynthesis genes